MRHIVIKVGETHHGSLKPGMLVAIPVRQVSFHGHGDVMFQNPLDNGWTPGTKVGEIDV